MLPRKLISQGDVHKNLMVEVYPLCLKFFDSRDNSQTVIWLSKKVQQSSFCFFFLHAFMSMRSIF